MADDSAGDSDMNGSECGEAPDSVAALMGGTLPRRQGSATFDSSNITTVKFGGSEDKVRWPSLFGNKVSSAVVGGSSTTSPGCKRSPIVAAPPSAVHHS